VAFRPLNTTNNFFWIVFPSGARSGPHRGKRSRRICGRSSSALLTTGYWLLAICYLLLAIKKSAPPAVGPRLSSHSGGGALKSNLAAHRIEQCDFRHTYLTPPVEISAPNLRGPRMDKAYRRLTSSCRPIST
jgi:hypothetical protein